ncbi:MAG: hypothetical protein ACLFTA_00890 [Candidatus Nanohaloarchaea archaeon]
MAYKVIEPGISMENPVSSDAIPNLLIGGLILAALGLVIRGFFPEAKSIYQELRQQYLLFAIIIIGLPTGLYLLARNRQ